MIVGQDGPEDVVVEHQSETVATINQSISISQSLITVPSERHMDDEDDIKEGLLRIGVQVLPPFLIAGMGMVVAGICLSHVQTWKVFINVPEIIILVPSLLGLKGNLEMTLASRLSTAANLRQMDNRKDAFYVVVGNLLVVQCQAIVVAFLSSIVAVIMVAAVNGQFNLTHILFLCASSLITASIASLLLGMVAAGVIYVSKLMSVNPDNVATPIAASLGDITSLGLLSMIASELYESIDIWWIAPTVIVIFIMIIPLCFFINSAWTAKHSPATAEVLYTSWSPVIIAMIISTLGGVFLDHLVGVYSGLAVFQPVINGVGGNLVSVHASRLSTELHKTTELGVLPPSTKILVSPYEAFFSTRSYAVTSRVLMTLVIPGHLIFIYAIYGLLENDMPTAFVVAYLFVSLIQVMTLLYLSSVLTHFCWSRKVDPDNSTIPYLTALGDFLGIILLGSCFWILNITGSPTP